MAGTNAVIIKKALFDALTEAPALNGVDISYHYRDDTRELVHGGPVEGTQRYPVSRGGGGRFPREERLTVKVFIVVRIPGAEPYDAELRCSEIGTVLEELLAADPDLVSIPGAVYGGIDSVAVDSDVDDEGANAVLEFDVMFESRLR